MFSYLVAVSVALFGIGPHAIHIAAAFVGLLTVPATYLLIETLFAEDDGWLGRYGGAVGSLMLAVSFWHLHWSRYGVRAILVPLFTALTMWALLRGLRTEDRRYFALSGVLLGLSFYTYQSARTLPALVVLAFAGAVVLRRSGAGSALRRLLLVAGIAAVVFAPMGVYILTHPGEAAERINQTWVFSSELSLRENAQRLRREVVDVARVLAVRGEEEVVHNLPGRPAMTPFLLTLFAGGVVIALTRIRRLSYAIVLAWLPVMGVTAILTLGGQPTKRAIGTLPAVAALVAVGALAPLDYLRRWAGRREMRWAQALSVAGVVALGLGFIYSGWAGYRDYFLVWGGDPNLFTHFEAGRAAIGAYARGLPPEERLYSSPEMPDHPSIVYNAGARAGMKGYNGRLCTVFPAETQAPTTYIIVSHEDRKSLDLLARVFPEGERVPAGPDFYGQPFFTAFRVPAGVAAQIAPSHVTPAVWEGKLRFMGYDLSAEAVRPGETLVLTLYYQALAPMDRNYVVFTHLLGSENPETGNRLWSQRDGEPCETFYPTSVWSAGEIVRDVISLPVPEDAPPGTYDLQMGFYTWPEMAHLRTEVGGTPEITHVFGQVEVAAP
jgi:hypothetical protein